MAPPDGRPAETVWILCEIGCRAGTTGPNRLPVERLLGIVWENDFATKANGRAPGREDPRSHYRKGTAGDWRNHFTERHVSYFKEHFGDLLVTLGYESGREWT